ncbi:uncharacterized protein MYCFIDRAFT_175314 [Pseudocercospora fijiensis CIRAD86]|uniref:Uncharacterized protein n=1 Tax=Pseudocercospora fijiensis (strain CIRAD86) TaxID=383855 RepID=M3AAY6_PSEFD|nr:uncharacterized protein MYCFIDRAFT_175314 [Pseudocercospora fijiensis CIRAD86]EME81731.1 hypothetical protein MYCFIDRAFT_175314 [Pseudocercospora fijiensis CIRAD86]
MEPLAVILMLIELASIALQMREEFLGRAMNDTVVRAHGLDPGHGSADVVQPDAYSGLCDYRMGTPEKACCPAHQAYLRCTGTTLSLRKAAVYGSSTGVPVADSCSDGRQRNLFHTQTKSSHSGDPHISAGRTLASSTIVAVWLDANDAGRRVLKMEEIARLNSLSKVEMESRAVYGLFILCYRHSYNDRIQLLALDRSTAGEKRPIDRGHHIGSIEMYDIVRPLARAQQNGGLVPFRRHCWQSDPSVPNLSNTSAHDDSAALQMNGRDALPPTDKDNQPHLALFGAFLRNALE